MPATAIKMGLLDFVAVDDSSYARSLSDALESVQLADSLHFSRFWLAEHHVWCGSGSPEMLLSLMAATTSRIKVGMAGVLLSFYSPYKVAETFQVLEELFPGRIDLGVCRGACDPVIAKALLEDRELDRSIYKYAADMPRLLAAHTNEYVLPTVIGTAAQCQDKILPLAEVHGVDEIIWLDLSPTRSEQKGSLSRLAARMGVSA